MKSKTHFHFKRFSVSHLGSAMKVGTDAVLLGAWANIDRATHILDIGTGNGTIALILAQRSEEHSKIDAVEIAKDESVRARENFKNSPWPHKINLQHSAIQEYFPSVKYDLIVCNPPYFNNSLIPPRSDRGRARHTIELTYRELISSATRLLSEDGKFNVILPFAEGLQFISYAEQEMLFCSRQYSFKTRPQKDVERWLLEFSKRKSVPETGEILLYKESDIWDESYVTLTKDFYIKL
jgi:tRNA1Val (adenine37-N6)-methyltransferase